MQTARTADMGDRNSFRFALAEDAKLDDGALLESNADLAGLAFLTKDTGLIREQIEAIVDKVSARRHPANTNPVQTPAELAALYRSMVGGYDDSEPVLVVDGKIVDGINREIVAELIRAKRQADFKCSIQQIAEGNAAKVVKSKNARRNLVEVAKAFQAARTLQKGAKHGDQKELALDSGVSTRLIRAACAVLEKIPELEENVLTGRLALMAAEKIAHSEQHTAETREYLAKRGSENRDVRRKLVDIADRAEEALATRKRVSSLLAKARKASPAFYRQFKGQIESETEPETNEAVDRVLKSPDLPEAMMAASKDSMHKDKTLVQLVALVTSEARNPQHVALTSERSSTALGGTESKPETNPGPRNEIHAAFAPIFKELGGLTAELLRDHPLPTGVRDDLVRLLREKTDLVAKAATSEESVADAIAA
jgi:hypothetical protein